MHKEKARLVVLAVGGTIAGSAASELSTTGYQAGVLGVEYLLEAVPGLQDYARVRGEQLVSIDSKDMTEDIWLRLAGRINELLASEEADGIVVTHGTDTLEETAYFLNLTVQSRKPVVLVGAMRPATALSADGPMNLWDAVRVAASEEAAGKGVLVVMNGEIHGAREVTKSHTTSVSTFRSPEAGVLGTVPAGEPLFFRAPLRRHTLASEFELAGLGELPCVKIIYGHAGDDALFAEAAIKAGAGGIIYAGPGNGSIPRGVEAVLAEAVRQGLVVVRSSRTGSGTVIAAEPSYREAHFVEGGSLNPQKARILLQLALTQTRDPGEIQRMFREY